MIKAVINLPLNCNMVFLNGRVVELVDELPDNVLKTKIIDLDGTERFILFNRVDLLIFGKDINAYPNIDSHPFSKYKTQIDLKCYFMGMNPFDVRCMDIAVNMIKVSLN